MLTVSAVVVFVLAIVGVFHPSDYKTEHPAMYMFSNEGMDIILIVIYSMGVAVLNHSKEDLTSESYKEQSIGFFIRGLALMQTIWPCDWIMTTVLLNLIYSSVFRISPSKITRRVIFTNYIIDFIDGFLVVFFSYSVCILYAHVGETDWCLEDNVDVINTVLILCTFVYILLLSLLRRSPAYLAGSCF